MKNGGEDKAPVLMSCSLLQETNKEKETVLETDGEKTNLVGTLSRLFGQF